MKLKIDIEVATFVRFWLVTLGFGIGALAVYGARTALVIIFVAFFLAMALNIPVSIIARKLPGKSRVGATAIAYLLVLVLLGLVVFLVVPPIVDQTAKFVQNVPSIVDNATAKSKGLTALIDKYNLRPQVDNAISSIQSSATGWATNIGKTVVSGIGSVFSFMAAALLVVVLTFLMLVEGPIWLDRLWSTYQDKKRMERHKTILMKMYNVVTGYVTGQLTVSAIGALFAGLCVWVLSFFFHQVPATLAFPTAAITFTLSLVPMFGATVAGLIVAGLLALNNLWAAVVYILFFALYQQIENNFISPRIQSKKLNLTALAVLVSVTIGLYFLGVAGGIIAIPLAGCVRVLIEERLKHRTTLQDKADRPVARFVRKLKGNQNAESLKDEPIKEV